MTTEPRRVSPGFPTCLASRLRPALLLRIAYTLASFVTRDLLAISDGASSTSLECSHCENDPGLG